MRATNLSDPTESVSFATAIRRGLGRNRGLFFPDEIPRLKDVDGLLIDSPHTRAVGVLDALVGDEIPRAALDGIVERAFTWDTPLVPVTDRICALELYWGPTLAFKDYGARFMADDGVDLFWADEATGPPTGIVHRKPLVGGAVPSPYVTGQDSPWDVDIDATNVYWANFGDTSSANGSIMFKPRCGIGRQPRSWR